MNVEYEILNEQEVIKLSNSNVLKMFQKTCEGCERVAGIHPLSHAYSKIHRDLEKELLRRMEESK